MKDTLGKFKATKLERVSASRPLIVRVEAYENDKGRIGFYQAASDALEPTSVPERGWVSERKMSVAFYSSGDSVCIARMKDDDPDPRVCKVKGLEGFARKSGFVQETGLLRLLGLESGLYEAKLEKIDGVACLILTKGTQKPLPTWKQKNDEKD